MVLGPAPSWEGLLGPARCWEGLLRPATSLDGLLGPAPWLLLGPAGRVTRKNCLGKAASATGIYERYFRIQYYTHFS